MQLAALRDFLLDFTIFLFGYLIQRGVLVLYLYLYRFLKGMIQLCGSLFSSTCCNYEGPFYWRILSRTSLDIHIS